MFAKMLGFHLVLCSLFFSFAYALWYFGFLPPTPPSNTLFMWWWVVFFTTWLVIFAVVLSSSYLCSNLIWYWVTSQITWMPPWVDDTESHTMGAFLLIRGREDIENLEVCAAGVVANAVLRPVDMVAKASANAGHIQPPELQLGRALSWQQLLPSLCNRLKNLFPTDLSPEPSVSPPAPGTQAPVGVSYQKSNDCFWLIPLFL